MNKQSDNLDLAMPLGLPLKGADKEAHYTAMASLLSIEITKAKVARIWVASNPLYANVHAMARAAVRYYPKGSKGPDGAAEATNTLYFKTWLWEYLSLKKSAGGGKLVPAVIRIANIDNAQMKTLVEQELKSNSRYKSRTTTERTQMKTDFLVGKLNLLVAAGTKVAQGAVDTMPPQPGLAGYRRIDLAFVDADGNVLDPSLFFDIWGAVGGSNVTGHPLLDLLKRELTPSAAPLEGGTRIRIKGKNLTDASTVSVEGKLATDVKMANSGKLLYATLPAGKKGIADIVIKIPGQPDKTISPGVRYVEDVVETARAVTASFIVHLTELHERVKAMMAVGTVSEDDRGKLRLELELAHRLSYEAIDERAAAGGGAANSPGVVDVLAKHDAVERGLLAKVITAIG